MHGQLRGLEDEQLDLCRAGYKKALSDTPEGNVVSVQKTRVARGIRVLCRGERLLVPTKKPVVVGLQQRRSFLPSFKFNVAAIRAYIPISQIPHLMVGFGVKQNGEINVQVYNCSNEARLLSQKVCLVGVEIVTDAKVVWDTLVEEQKKQGSEGVEITGLPPVLADPMLTTAVRKEKVVATLSQEGELTSDEVVDPTEVAPVANEPSKASANVGTLGELKRSEGRKPRDIDDWVSEFPSVFEVTDQFGGAKALQLLRICHKQIAWVCDFNAIPRANRGIVYSPGEVPKTAILAHIAKLEQQKKLEN